MAGARCRPWTFLLASPEYLDAQFPDAPRILVPWLQYKQHVDAIRFWYAQGHEHPQFLLGEFSKTGWPHYYFVAFFLKTPLKPQGGMVMLPDTPGLGMELDEAKVEDRRILSWGAMPWA